jgi:hypothetical protein
VHGFLTQDSLIVAAAQDFGIDALASADAEFALAVANALPTDGHLTS